MPTSTHLIKRFAAFSFMKKIICINIRQILVRKLNIKICLRTIFFFVCLKYGLDVAISVNDVGCRSLNGRRVHISIFLRIKLCLLSIVVWLLMLSIGNCFETLDIVHPLHIIKVLILMLFNYKPLFLPRYHRHHDQHELEFQED